MPTPVRQLLSQTIYDTDGTSTEWEFAFSGGYLSTSHVKAKVYDGISYSEITVTPAMLTGLFTLRIVPALAAGQVLTIYRSTPKDLPIVDFTDEAGFTEIALDTNAKQAIFVAAESYDSVGAVNTEDLQLTAQTAVQAAAQASAAALAAAADAAQVNAILGLVAGYTVAIRASGNGTQTAFSISLPTGNVGLSVYIGGVYQQTNTYGRAGGTVTFTEAPVAGTDNIEFVLTVATPLEELSALTVQASAAAVTATAAASDAQSAATAAATSAAETAGLLGTKQNTLVSGSNIKTVNGNSLLGSGDLAISGGGGATDHGALTGLADDDHPQYFNAVRGDVRYAALAHDHTIANVTGLQGALDGKAPTVHTQAASTISDSTAVGRSVLTAADAAAARTAIGAGTGNGDVTLTGAQSISGKTVYTFAGEFDSGDSGTAKTITFANGQKQRLRLTGNVTITLSFPAVGNYQLILKQDATGSRTVAFAGSPEYLNSATLPAINTAANGRTLVSAYWDGTGIVLGVAKIGAA